MRSVTDRIGPATKADPAPTPPRAARAVRAFGPESFLPLALAARRAASFEALRDSRFLESTAGLEDAAGLGDAAGFGRGGGNLALKKGVCFLVRARRGTRRLGLP